MKNIFVVMTLTLVLLLVGCTGENGQPGDVYLRYSWGSSLESYWDTTPFSTISSSYRQLPPGTYSYDYETTTHYVWGTFTLVANDGEKGGPFFKKGSDGADRHYTAYIYSSYLSLSKPSVSNVFNKRVFGKEHQFDSSLPIHTRADTTEGAIIIWRYQERLIKEK